VFPAGDLTHPQDNLIYEMLDLIYFRVRVACHVPDHMDQCLNWSRWLTQLADQVISFRKSIGFEGKKITEVLA
jgi:hypothetical protein